MNEISKRALKTSLKNCETKVARSNQWANQWANQRAGFQWAGFQRASFRGALLLGAILLSLLFVGNLQAQSPNGQSSVSTKQGFFAGIVYLQGFGVDTTKTSTNSSTGYRISGYGDETSGVSISIPFNLDSATKTGIRTLMEANCERNETSVDSNGNYSVNSNFFSTFDPGAKPTKDEIVAGDATVTFLNENILSRNFRTGLTTGETSYCKTYFDNLPEIKFSAYEIATPDSPSTTTPNTESDALNGVGLQFGWRGEKWRASLTHFTGKGGANELVNTVVMADYFFHEEFFVGGGLASMKLTNGSTSASATSPVVQVGYKENLTPNLFFNISLTKYLKGISLNRTVSAPIPTGKTFSETQIEIGKDSHKATIGLDFTGPLSNMASQLFYNNPNFDKRIEATQVRTRDVEIQEVETPATQKIEAEIKAPVVVSISLLWRF